MRDKFLTVLVVPHDERNVRQMRVSYRRARVFAGIAGIVAVLVLVAVVSYGRVAARASRVVAVERENARLQAENEKVEEIAANLARTEAAYERIRTLAGLEPTPSGPGDVAGDGEESERPRGWPLAKRGFVSAGFEGEAGHSGVDIAVATGTPVLATAAGLVIESRVDDVLGELLVIEHGSGLETVYAHNASRLVTRGARVERGATIAYSGNSGRSTAPHLHYEIRRDGNAIDPSPFMN